MSAPHRDDVLQAYLTRILALKDQQPAGLSAGELEAIALELGLSEADLAAGQAEAERYFQRGAGFMRHQRWDDAITELSAAAALAPGRLAVLHALAEAHAARWRAGRDRGDRDRAEALARRCLDLAPDHEASFTLLNALDGQGPIGQVPGRPAALPLVLTLIGLGALVYAVATFWTFQRETALPPGPPPAQPQLGQAKPDPLVEIPVTLVADAKGQGMRATPRLSQLTNYATSSYYKQAIALTNTGQTEWQELVVQAEYLDAAGKVIDQEPIRALQAYQAGVRPGDVHLFNRLKATTPALASVRLRVTVRNELPVRAIKLAAKPLAVDWAIAAPPGVSLRVKERSGAVTRSQFVEGAYLKPILEIENTGDVAVKTLKMELTAYDAAGKALKTNQRLAVSGDGMALAPGETRLDHWHEQVPANYHHYELRVVEVE
ncbi:hypothetical protein D3C72_944090 [compost metagenome]